MSEKFNLGVVGYCPPSHFDEDEARKLVNEGFDKFAAKHPNAEINVVSGLTHVGVIGIAYEEAQKRGWRTTGIACEKAKEHSLFPVDDQQIVGKNWGDESETFIEAIDGILRIGGGRQSKTEVALVQKNNGEAIEYELDLITVKTRDQIENL